jgi:hypothetical protein
VWQSVVVRVRVQRRRTRVVLPLCHLVERSPPQRHVAGVRRVLNVASRQSRQHL